MSNVTTRQKLDVSILVAIGMDERREALIESGISKTYLSKQKTIQEAIVRDYRTKFEAEELQ